MVDILTLVFSTCCAIAAAFPSFRSRLPNGYRVQCPFGVEGCTPGDELWNQPGFVCNGVGHNTCEGGTMPLNLFGIAFEQTGMTWTEELCNADSDGDGLSNGEELGDPCCLWSENDGVSEYTETFAATHPGFANHPDIVAAYTRPTCNITAPPYHGVTLSEFKEGEEQRSIDVHIDNFEVPSSRTTYVDIGLNFPDDSLGKFHVIHMDAIVDKWENLHHYVLKGCRVRFPPELNGKQINRQDMETYQCFEENFGGWAPGKPIVQTPPWAGKPIGADVGVVAFAVNVHYDNQPQTAGITDSSGIRIFYTPTLRDIEIGSASIAAVSRNNGIQIPPGKKRWFFTRSCELDVRDVATGEPAEFHVFTIGYHAHLLGSEMYAEIRPAGETDLEDLGSEAVWHFDDQWQRNMLGPDREHDRILRTGDHIEASCVMDSTERTEATKMGVETTDEMCWVSIAGWPATVRARCNGPFWSGELADDEPGHGLQTRHPLADATDAWDGSHLGTGGSRISNPKCWDNPDDPECEFEDVTCEDVPAWRQHCDEVLSGMVDHSKGCHDELGELHNALSGKSGMSVCCGTLCRHDICSDQTECGPSAGSPTCKDKPDVAQFCGNIVNRLLDSGKECDAEVGFVDARLEGYTVADVCCETVCNRDECSNHQICNANASTSTASSISTSTAPQIEDEPPTSTITSTTSQGPLEFSLSGSTTLLIADRSDPEDVTDTDVSGSLKLRFHCGLAFVIFVSNIMQLHGVDGFSRMTA